MKRFLLAFTLVLWTFCSVIAQGPLLETNGGTLVKLGKFTGQHKQEKKEGWIISYAEFERPDGTKIWLVTDRCPPERKGI